MAINNTVEDINNQPTIQPQTVTGAFLRYIAKTIPLAFDESMSYYECICALRDYINQFIDNLNNVNDGLSELQTFYLELQDYVNHYFDNLDVQQEINNKLDEMANDGSLTNLIKDYIDPLYQDYENSINQTIELQNANIQAMNNKINAVTNNNPIPVSNISDMTDTTKIYVLTTTGYWYYYDGDSWEQGGIYQSSVDNYDTTLTQNDAVPNSQTIGNKINQDYKKFNILNINNMQLNKKYESNGTLSTSENWYLFDDIIQAKNGDRLILQYIDTDGKITTAQIDHIVKVNADGDFLSLVTGVIQSYYVFDEDCFFKVNCQYHSAAPTITNYVGYLNNINADNISNDNETSLNKIGVELNKKDIEDITTQYNYFNAEESFLNQNINAYGVITYTNNEFFITNLIKVKSGDVLYSNYFGTYSTPHNIFQVLKYDSNKRFIERISLDSLSYTADFNGYVKFNVKKATSETKDHLSNNYAISKGSALLEFYPYKKYIVTEDDYPVKVYKINDNNFTIEFGKFNVTLFKTISSSTNSNNWNLKDVKNGSNIIVPTGTDIIGPIKINNNTDFIGGVHGDETTNEISLTIDGQYYDETDLLSIDTLKGKSLSITMKSTCYDQIAGDAAFDRYVIINIESNKIHISNSYKAVKNLTLRTAKNGGLIACRNNIIKNITMNNLYLSEPPTTEISNESKLNTSATINTIYGSVTINNIKGYTNDNYIGWLRVFTSESPIRCKIYFDTYKVGNYPLVIGDIITGEFEYLFN